MILAQLVGGGVTLTAIGIATVIILLIALLARHRLPVGISSGLFVAGLSTALVVHYGAVGVVTERPLYRLAVTFAGLSLFWLIVVAWVERGAQPGDARLVAQQRQSRRMIGLHAAAGAGLLAAGTLLAIPSAALALLGASPALIVCMLLAVTAGCYVHAPGPLPRYAATALVGLLIWLTAPRAATEAQGGRLAWLVLGGGAGLLGIVVATVLRDWRRRITEWRRDPASLLDDPPPYRMTYGAVVVLAMGVGLLGVVVPRAIVTPLGLFLTSLAVLAIGHRRRSDGTGEVGMGLVLITIATLPQGWLPGGMLNAILGLALAGAYLVWQGRFWEQQLDDGRPWTTAGRLIPYVRQLSIVAGAASATLTVVWLWRSPSLARPSAWIAVLTLLSLLLHGSMLIREARRHALPAAAMVGVLVWLAALVPADMLLGSGAASLLLALAGLALTLRLGAQPDHDECGWVYNAYVGGIIPAAVVYAAIFADDPSQRPIITGLAAVGTIAAIGLRFGLFLRQPSGPAEGELTT